MPIEDIANLINGFARFQQRYFEESPQLYSDLQEGQHPSTLLIGCCDSRVDPALLLDCDPGDIFTVRNIANLVPPSSGMGPQAVLAAVQYAVQVLQVDRIIILGHASCGGIRALMQAEPNQGDIAEDDHVRRWMDVAWPARELVMKSPSLHTEQERLHACEQASILISLKNLEKMACVKERLDNGTLTLHGWYFDLHTGSLLAYSDRADAFLPLFCPIGS